MWWVGETGCCAAAAARPFPRRRPQLVVVVVKRGRGRKGMAAHLADETRKIERDSRWIYCALGRAGGLMTPMQRGARVSRGAAPALTRTVTNEKQCWLVWSMRSHCAVRLDSVG